MTAARLVMAAVCALAFAACRESGTSHDDASLPTQDSLSTGREVQASLSGTSAPGGQTYTYRQLYAGMTRAALEERIVDSAGVHSTRRAVCEPPAPQAIERRCRMEGFLAPDRSAVQVEAVYSGLDSADARATAREITIVRELPLDVDGVRLARALSDAFERQTTLLDRRDAAYGHHQASVRMGTLNGARQNFAEVTVEPKLGRERLTVRLSRSSALPQSGTHP